MKIVIITSSRNGTASHHIPYLMDCKDCEIVTVILSNNIIRNKKSHYKKKIGKILKIGIFGAINGIRMRSWYKHAADKNQDIEILCTKFKIPFFQCDAINSDETGDIIKKSDADLGISIGNGYIASKIFSIPKYGMLNIHHEILPDYQNAQSIIWQLYNNSTYSGYTIHKIDKSIDTGEILHQEKIPIDFKATLKETIASNYSKLIDASAVGLVYCIQNFKSVYFNAKAQGKGKKYTTPSFREYLKIVRSFKNLKAKRK